MRRRFLLSTIAFLGVWGLERFGTAAPIDFQRNVRPILAEKCYVCHGLDARDREADLRLDSAEGATAKRKSGQAIVPGDVERSEVWKRVTSSDPESIMPPAKTGKALTASEKATLRAWIAQGAVYQSHWAFEMPRAPSLPQVKHVAWPKNAIDTFILSRLEQEGLPPPARASRETLLRRVTLDLTGLPPTPDAVRTFAQDESIDSLERRVDELMTTRDYAERRAQDWLDLARYADSNGFADDGPRAIWPFRDWVIAAFQSNMPYDRFTIEQLAGDMLPDATLDQRIASAFHRNAPQAKGNTYPAEEYRIKGVVDRVNTTGAVWLGLTLGCAECHDHKFDPISQQEYYSLFALFNHVVHTGEGFSQDGPSLKTPTREQSAQLAQLLRQRDDIDRQTREREKTVAQERLQQDTDWMRLRAERTAFANQIVELEKRFAAVPVMQERTQPRETFIHLRGNFLNRGARVFPAVPAIFASPSGGQPKTRLEFARWLVDGNNPLVARVVVNRIWQACFGQGLVRTPVDFGVQGAAPTHPELLDYLACELLASGWNMRHIHRLIVTSATYAQSSRVDAHILAHDPQNLLLSRMPRPRLPAEQIRDQALAIADLLSPSAGGNSVFPVQPANYWEERALPGKWKTGAGADRYRKSLYTYWRRMALHPSFELLDAPARTVCTARRSVSNVPTQALVTLNDPMFVDAAQGFARRLLQAGASSDAERVSRAFLISLGRSPAPEELGRFVAAIQEQRENKQDETAVWTFVATVLLNLDEALCRP